MVAVWLDDKDETTLKYFYKEANRIRLQPANPTMGPIYVDDPASLRIMGKVVHGDPADQISSRITIITIILNNKKSSKLEELFVFGQRLGKFDNATSGFEFALGIGSCFFADCGEDFGASGLGHGLGFNQAKVGEVADDFDDFDLLGTGVFEDDIELGLFFDGFSGGSGSSGSSHGNRCGGGNAPFFFEGFYQFSGFENRELAQLFNNFCYISHFKSPL